MAITGIQQQAVDKPQQSSAGAAQLQTIEHQRVRVIAIEASYLILLFAIAAVYLGGVLKLPPTLGGLPIGVPWFGALGAVLISLTGTFDHQKDWDSSWNPWH